jgi:hypothetical protein
MLNSTIFGGLEARQELARAHLALKVDNNWCLGGCSSWKSSKEGRKRFRELKRKNDERKAQGLSHV